VRFDDAEEAMLDHLGVESEDSKSDILRNALRTYYKIQAKKW
jgi:predicted transcriptional regulator